MVSQSGKLISPDHEYLVYTGRVDFSDPKAPKFAWPGISIKGAFSGHYLEVFLDNQATTSKPTANANYYNVLIDDSLYQVIRCENGGGKFVIAENLPVGSHTFEIYKRTESSVGVGVFKGLRLSEGATLMKYSQALRKRIEFIGNSITCGYGIEGESQHCKFTDSTENNYKSYAAMTARNFHADGIYIAYSGRGIYWNYGKDTVKPTMVELYNAVFPDNEEEARGFSNNTADLYVINLGTNDFTHENPDSLLWTHAYLKLIDKLREKSKHTPIVCCLSPMTSDYWPKGNKARTTLKNYLDGVVAYRNKSGDEHVYFCEFQLQGKYGYGCGWHPSYLQHQQNAQELTEFISKTLHWKKFK